MAHESGGCSATASARGPLCIVGELVLVMLVFAASGARPVPDVNEAVYLAKARHSADPSWGRGDFFLETPEAHGLFYRCMGPVAAALPLDTAAWVGRVLGWLALAVGFRHAVTPLVGAAPRSAGRSWAVIIAAALFALALRTTTAAGEWVIGGCEAKVFAWALVFGGWGEFCKGGYAASFGLFGAATAVHPVVGGWALLAALAARLAGGWPADVMRPVPRAAASAACIGLVAWGVVPALGLSSSADAACREAATRTYVVERLAHHLLPRTFADGLVTRHLLAVVVAWLLWRIVPATAARNRAAALTAAALAISAAGWGISLLEPWAADVTYALLKYYWFRLADVAVPFALSAVVVAVLQDDGSCRALGVTRRAGLAALVTVVMAADVLAQSRHWPLPGRDHAPRADARVEAAAWSDICAWVRDHAPPDACFLTPRGSATFTWRTGRREVVSWKNSPQDARSLVEWRRRFGDCFSVDGGLVNTVVSTASLGPERMRAVAERYGADHAIVPLSAWGAEDLPFERLHTNAGYAVYRLPGR